MGVGLLAAVTLLLRLATRSVYLFNWDAVQFALGVQRFDLVAHRPHPPGYLGYVELGRAFTTLAGGRPADGLVLLSAVAEALAVVVGFTAARALWGRFSGWTAAVLFATSPLVWIYGGVGLTYALEPALAVVVLWAAVLACRGERRALLVAAVAAALAGAIRPTDELFLAAPVTVAAWTAWRDGGIRAILPAVLVLAAVSAAWVLPLVMASGGLGTYVTASRELSARASDTSAIWRAGLAGAWRNGDAVVAGLATALGLVVPLGTAAALLRAVRLERDFALLALSLLVPAVGVYVLVHIGQLGYLLLLVPAVLLPAGLGLDGLAQRISVPHRGATRAGLLALCALVNVAIFALPAGGMRDQVASHDALVAGLLATVRGYDPGSTVLVTSAEADGSYRDVQYYLGGYAVIAAGRDRVGHAGEIFATGGSGEAWRAGVPEYDLARFNAAGPVRLPSTARTLLVLDPGAMDVFGDRGRASVVHFGDGGKLWVIGETPGVGAVASGGFIYARPADCPCNGAGHARPARVPGEPL